MEYVDCDDAFSMDKKLPFLKEMAGENKTKGQTTLILLYV